jgi:DNA-binding MarR family transcriptional regulator
MVATPDDDGLRAHAAAVDEAALALCALWAHPSSDPELPIPATQLRALFVVDRGPVNVSGLAAELGALTSSASRLCDRLEAAGLLVRDHGKDRREVTVRVTPEGKALLDRLRRRRQGYLAEVFARMPPPAVAALLWGLTEFQEAAAGKEAGESTFSLPA